MQHVIMKISKNRELQQIPSNHSSDIEFKDFMKLYKDETKKLGITYHNIFRRTYYKKES